MDTLPSGVGEEMGWEYKLTPVSQMESILSGLEQGRFDAAIGAITITPEREARIDFHIPRIGPGWQSLCEKKPARLPPSVFSAASEERF